MVSLSIRSRAQPAGSFHAFLGRRLGRKCGSHRPNRRTDHARLASAGAAGGFEHVLFAQEEALGQEGWIRVKVRQVLFVPPAKVAGLLADPRVANYSLDPDTNAATKKHNKLRVTLRHHASPRPVDLVAIVARARRYPRVLSRGEAWPVREMLGARAKHRLSTKFGEFYGNKWKAKAKEKPACPSPGATSSPSTGPS